MNRNIFRDNKLQSQTNNQQYQLINGRYVCLPSQQNSISTNPEMSIPNQQPNNNVNRLKQNTKDISKNLNNPLGTVIKKYNPDIEPNLKSLEHKRDNTKFSLTNSRYKTILNDVEIPQKIKNTKDLSLNIVEDKDESKLNTKLDELNDERKYVDKKREEMYNETNREDNKKKFKFRNEEIYKLNRKNEQEQEIDGFDNLKQEVADYYKKVHTDLEKDREVYNEIIDSLVNAGVFDD